MKALLSIKKSEKIATNSYFRLKRGEVRKSTLKDACKYAWIRLLDHLRPGQPWADVVVWELGERISVRPACSVVDESSRRFERASCFWLEDRGYQTERKKIGRIKNKAQAKREQEALDREFRQSVADAVVGAFQLKEVQQDYQKYNPDNRPFVILLTDKDAGLHASQFTLLWKNRKGLGLQQLRKAARSAKGQLLPTQPREGSPAERRKEKLRVQRQKERKSIQKARAKRQAAEQAKRTAKSKRKIPAQVVKLEPNIRFPSGTIVARCATAWMKLFEILHQYSVTPASADGAMWEANLEAATVQLVPQLSKSERSEVRWDTPPQIRFQVDEFARQWKRLGGAKQQAARKRLRADFHKWLNEAIVEAFLSEAVHVEYSWFNEEDDSFEVRCQLTANTDSGKASLLWSSRRPAKKAKAKKPVVKKSRPKDVPDTSAKASRRFYFDDGETRKFWHVRSQGAALTIVQGKTGARGASKTDKRKSPAEAKAAMKRLIEQKRKQGYIEYAPGSLHYERKNRFAIKLIRKALADFEKERGFRIPEEFRRHILSANGGRPQPNSVSLPRHPYLKSAKVGDVLGFKAGQPAFDVDYFASMIKFPDGHVPVADGMQSSTVDQDGVIHLWDTDRLDKRDYADDNTAHVDMLPPFVVAQSFDELLTRIARFPHDTNAEVKAPRSKTDGQQRQEADNRLAAAKQAAAQQPLRRFFFDDGETRKYWHIETRGQQFTTRYARLGAPPGETTKSFPSADEARAAADKIIAQKVKKGYQEVLPDALLITRPQGVRRATAAAIQKLEKQLRAPLPEEYRQFLASQNGGQPYPGFVKITGVPHIDVVDVGFLFGLYSKDGQGSLQSALESARRILPADHLPVAGASDFFTLSLKRRPGCVYFWDHESDDIDKHNRFRRSAGHLFAHSFDEFLTRIALYRSDG